MNLDSQAQFKLTYSDKLDVRRSHEQLKRVSAYGNLANESQQTAPDVFRGKRVFQFVGLQQKG